MSSSVVTGNVVRIVKLRMFIGFALRGFSVTKNPFKIIQAIIDIQRIKRELVDVRPINKLVKVDGRYYWDLTQPGWPSVEWNRNSKWIMNQLVNGDKKDIESVRLVFFAITKKCPMNCEHCYEWDEINKKETLTLETLKAIVDKYQNLGAAYFILGGGEPLVRYKDLVALLDHAESTSEFWITTSGFGLTKERASELKKAGLKGVSISLDHSDHQSNNAFRGHKNATGIALEAAQNAKHAGLVVAFGLCATKEFISDENLSDYADMALSAGSDFIWIIEPRAVGRYAGKNVELSDDHFEKLNEFTISMNYDSEYKKYPRVIFPNYAHRKKGCAGAGRNSIMIDTDGFISPCPFCRSKGVYALADNVKDELEPLFKKGCLKFETREI